MADEPVIDYTPFPCPIGYYCTNGTRFSTEYPCPSGTYGPVQKLQSEDECYPCDPGMLLATKTKHFMAVLVTLNNKVILGADLDYFLGTEESYGPTGHIRKIV